MVGRDDAVQQLRAAVAASAGGLPQHVVVGGEAGVGKTRLLERIAELAASDGARVLVGGCVAMGVTGLPFAPYAEIVRTLISEDGAPNVAAYAGRAAPDLGKLVPEIDVDGAPTDHEPWARSRLYEALSSVFRYLARRDPIVLVLEDMHWADAETVSATSFLMRAARDEPITFLASFRSDGDARTATLRAWLADIARDDHVDRLDLQPLSEDDVAMLVPNIVDEQVGTAELAEIQERSDGNPFFVEELLASRGVVSGALPSSLRDVLLARVEVLSPSARSLISVAAIGGREVEHGRLIAVADRSPGDASTDLAELVDAGLMLPSMGANGEDTYSFRHALLQEAVSDAVLPVERKRLHAAWAVVLQDRGGQRPSDATHLVELSHHLRAANDERALATSIAAGDAAMAGNSFAIALAEYEAALSLWDEGTTESRADGANVDHSALLTRTSRAAHLASEIPRAVSASREALEAFVGGDAARVTELQVSLARVLWISGSWTEAIHRHEEALRVAPSEPPIARTLAMAGLGQVYMNQGYFEQARPLLEEAIDRARSIGARPLEGHALISLARVLVNHGEYPAARSAADEGMAIALEVGAPDEIGRAYHSLAEVIARNGSPVAALAVSLEGVAVLDEYGVAKSYGQDRRYGSIEYAFECGDRDEAASRLAETDRASSLRTSEGVASAYLVVAHLPFEYLVCTGTPEAEQMWSRLRPMLASEAPSYTAGPIYIGAIELAAFAGRYEEAMDVAREGLDQVSKTDGWIEIAGLARMAAWPLAEVGIDATARARIDEIRAAEMHMDELLELLERAKEWLGRPTGRLGTYLDLLGSQVEGERGRMRGHADPEHWRSIADGLYGINRPFRALMARWREAEAAYGAGDRSSAVRVAGEAYQDASDLGATPLMAQLERLARKMRTRLTATASGETGAHVAPYGLTSREREVLTLVAAGRTNRQIGDELFISKSTAGVHVSNILAKLGVSTRADAGRIAVGEGITEEWTAGQASGSSRRSQSEMNTSASVSKDLD